LEFEESLSLEIFRLCLPLARFWWFFHSRSDSMFSFC